MRILFRTSFFSTFQIGFFLFPILLLSSCARLVPLQDIPQDEVDLLGRTHFHRSCISGQDVDAIAFLERDPSILNAKDNVGYTGIAYAVTNQHEVLAAALIDYGANLTLQDNSRESLLHKAVRGKNYSIIPLLFYHGLRPDHPNSNKQTPLHLAAENGDTVFVKSFLKETSSINTLDDNGNSPLHLAILNIVERDSINIHRFKPKSKSTPPPKKSFFSRLINFFPNAFTSVTGIFTGKRKNSGLSKQEKEKLRLENQYITTVELLLDAGADPSKKNNDGYTALNLALKKQNTNLVGVFIERSLLTYNDLLRYHASQVKK